MYSFSKQILQKYYANNYIYINSMIENRKTRTITIWAIYKCFSKSRVPFQETILLP